MWGLGVRVYVWVIVEGLGFRVEAVWFSVSE